jgi:hypothetical protein
MSYERSCRRQKTRVVNKAQAKVRSQETQQALEAQALEDSLTMKRWLAEHPEENVTNASPDPVYLRELEKALRQTLTPDEWSRVRIETPTQGTDMNRCREVLTSAKQTRIEVGFGHPDLAMMAVLCPDGGLDKVLAVTKRTVTREANWGGRRVVYLDGVPTTDWPTRIPKRLTIQEKDVVAP